MMTERKSKQVLIWRNELKVRKGKLAAQIAHASLSSYFKADKFHQATREWVSGIFTKVCCYVETEAELKEIYEKAFAKGLPCSLIVDSGLTEFNGVPTTTCVGIGPCWNDEVDEITGHLKLL